MRPVITSVSASTGPRKGICWAVKPALTRKRSAARWEADWAILQTKGHADVFIIKSAEVVPSNVIVAAMQDELKKHCGTACKSKVVNVPVTDWATKIQGEVQSALTADPGVNYVIPIYDSMSQFAVPAIAASGAQRRVRIDTFNGTPFVLKLLQDQGVVAMDVGESLAWVGWASMDQVFRVIAGEPPVRSEHTPVRVFDASNVGEAGHPPRFDTGYGNAYVDGYRMPSNRRLAYPLSTSTVAACLPFSSAQ